MDAGHLTTVAAEDDGLEFTGFDLGSARHTAMSPQPANDFHDRSDSPDESLRQVEDEETKLVASANAKLRKASDQGKSHAIMTQDEADALERHRNEQEKKRMWAPASPPRRSNTLSGLRVAKTRRADGHRVFSSPAANSSRARKSLNPRPLDDDFNSRNTSPYSPYSFEARHRVPGSFEEDRSVSYDAVHGPHSYRPRAYARPPQSRSASAPRPEAQPYQTRERASSGLVRRPVERTQAYSTARRNVSGPAEYAYANTRRLPRPSVLEPIASPTREAFAEHHPAAMTPGYWGGGSPRRERSRGTSGNDMYVFDDDEESERAWEDEHSPVRYARPPARNGPLQVHRARPRNDRRDERI